MNKNLGFVLSTMIPGLLLLSSCGLKITNKPIGLWQLKQQMVLVLSSDWEANQGVLIRFQYLHDHWKPIGHSFIVSLGKNGSAWGVGMSPLVKDYLQKSEGDMRSPAGIFKIGESFGYAKNADFNYPYKALTKDDYCIDNSQSIYYNRIINHQQIPFDLAKDTTEPMRRDLHLNGDSLYKLGFVLKYNPHNIPQMGSCVFVHLRKNANTTTAGCTAMDEQNMKEVLGWLNSRYHPIFVLLPIKAYQQNRARWNLPQIKFLLK